MKRWLALLFLCTACEPAKNDCATVDCGAGECVIAASGPRCLCEPGFVATTLRCTPLPPDAGDADAGIPDAGPAPSCEPNPCTAPHQTQCTLVGAETRCTCDPGFRSGLDATCQPVWSCSAQHPTGDAAEPDECPPLAPLLVFGATLERTLEPADDHDWFRVEAVVGDIIEVTATSESVPLLLEVFDGPATTQLAADTRGVLAPKVSFLADQSPLFVRVRALRSNDTGPYQLISRLLGTDDFANTAAAAPHLMPAPTPVMGAVQYTGDLDVLWMSLAPGIAWHFSVAESPLTGNTRVELQRVDGGAVPISDLGTGITVEATEEVLLVARGRTPESLGAFSVGLESLGPDDYSDTPQLGPMISLTQSVQGRIERPGDVDGFRLHVTRNHVYSVHGTVTSSTGALAITVSDGTATLQSPIFGQQDFVAPADADVFVSVASAFSTTLPIEWSLSADDFGIDDFSNTPPGAPISLGVSQAGRIERHGDIDVFRITAATGHVVRVQLVTPGTTSLSLFVVNSDGATVANGVAPLQFMAFAGGDYDLFVSGSPTLGNTPYTLTVSDLGVDDFGNAPAEASPLASGAPRVGAIQYPNDNDAFSFVAQPDHVYDLANGTTSTTLQLTVQGPGGTLVSQNGAPVSFYGGATGGQVTVLVSSAGVVQPYTLTLTDRGPEDHGTTPATATTIALDTPVAGRIGYSGDVDAFSLALQAGRVFTIAITTPDIGLRVSGPTGADVVSIPAGQTLRFLAASAGTYTVYASGPGYGPSSLPPYTLTVSDSGVDDHGDTNVTATAMSLGTAQTGALQYSGDIDVFALPVTAGRFYEARCGAGASCIIEVQSLTGAIIARSVGSNLAVNFKAPSSTVFLQVLSTGATFSYSLVALELGSDDHGDTPQTASVLPLATTLAGTLEIASDVDTFSVAVSAGDILKFTCLPPTGVSCFVDVRTSSGVRVVSTSYSQTLGARAEQADTWTLTVSTNPFASAGFSYTVRRDAVSDDHGGTNATATPLTIGTSASGIINYGADLDVFAFTSGTQQLEVVVTGSASFVVEIHDATDATVFELTEYDQWTPPSAGTWYLWLRSPFGGTIVAPYSVIIR